MTKPSVVLFRPSMALGAILAALFALNSAIAQDVQPGSTIIPSAGAYNASPPTCTASGICTLQTDVNGQLKVSVTGGGSGGFSTTDEAAFTAGNSVFAGNGGFFQTTATDNALTNGQQGMWQMTANRAGFVNLRNTAGAAIGVSAAPLFSANASGSIASGAVASGAVASGAIASGAYSSGAYAAGALAAGAFAAGSGVDGWDLTQGAIADAAVTAGATGSVSAKLRSISRDIGTVATNTAAATPAGTARIGYTSDDPCTQKTKTNLAISQNGTSSVQLIALSGSTVVYVCSLSLVAAGATTVALTTGTGSACVTGNAAVIGTTTASIANSLSLAANGGLTLGNGGGTVAAGAASSELCMILGTNVFVSGNLTYVQQ